jgi:DNA-binding GntR family transcriptional regulator
VAGDYQPGERLGERELCSRFGVSRTVVREALRFLEAEGLVTVIPNSGPIVRGISYEEAVSIFELRAVLESLAAELFARKATPAERERLERSLDLVRNAFEDESLANSLSAKDEFYAALSAGAHNDILGDTLLRLQSQVGLLRRLSLGAAGRRPQTLREVTEIVTRAVAGEPDEAARAARLHVEAAARVAMKRLEEESLH